MTHISLIISSNEKSFMYLSASHLPVISVSVHLFSLFLIVLLLLDFELFMFLIWAFFPQMYLQCIFSCLLGLFFFRFHFSDSFIVQKLHGLSIPMCLFLLLFLLLEFNAQIKHGLLESCMFSSTYFMISVLTTTS